MNEQTDIEHFDEASFQQKIQTGTTLVDFYADWCGPCRMMSPVLEKVAKEVKAKAKIAKLDIDQAQKIASQYQVTSIPTLILYKEGKEVGRLVGLRDAGAIKQFIESV
ncbi:MAG: thioredoxin [Chlamydiota bacterium]|jgi:thioredoxin 1